MGNIECDIRTKLTRPVEIKNIESSIQSEFIAVEVHHCTLLQKGHTDT